jgi:septal ring factor EnvC (AmiA/AmiB activator)
MQQTCESGHQPIMFVGDCPICVKEVPLLDKFRRLLDVFLDTSVAFGKVKDELATANDRIKARDTQIAQRDKTIASLVNPIRRFVADMPCTLRVSPKESSSDH